MSQQDNDHSFDEQPGSRRGKAGRGTRHPFHGRGKRPDRDHAAGREASSWNEGRKPFTREADKGPDRRRERGGGHEDAGHASGFDRAHGPRQRDDRPEGRFERRREERRERDFEGGKPERQERRPFRNDDRRPEGRFERRREERHDRDFDAGKPERQDRRPFRNDDRRHEGRFERRREERHDRDFDSGKPERQDRRRFRNDDRRPEGRLERRREERQDRDFTDFTPERQGHISFPRPHRRPASAGDKAFGSGRFSDRQGAGASRNRERASRGRDRDDSFEDDWAVSRRSFDVLILGAGASGLVCAAELAEKGLSVAVVDRSRTPGRKLAMSGGGRANFSNVHLGPEHYVCETPDFVAPVLERVGADAVCSLMDSMRLPWSERGQGRLFLETNASDLVGALMGRCRRGEFAFFGGEALGGDCLDCAADGVILRTRTGLVLSGRRAVLALGSPALPAIGSSGKGYAIAQALGHTLVPPEAALTPLFLEQNSPLLGLQGVGLPVVLKTAGQELADDLLFTHMGLSGPAALKASLYWEPGEPVKIDFLPGRDPFEGQDQKTVLNALSRHMPRRLAERLVPEDLADWPCLALTAEEKAKLLRTVHQYELLPSGMAGLRQAEVCRGGVTCSEVEPVTFVSRKVPRLSIIGEVLDVTGLLGGYNLHWAFASALLAARALASALAGKSGTKPKNGPDCSF